MHKHHIYPLKSLPCKYKSPCCKIHRLNLHHCNCTLYHCYYCWREGGDLLVHWRVVPTKLVYAILVSHREQAKLLMYPGLQGHKICICLWMELHLEESKPGLVVHLESSQGETPKEKGKSPKSVKKMRRRFKSDIGVFVSFVRVCLVWWVLKVCLGKM